MNKQGGWNKQGGGDFRKKTQGVEGQKNLRNQ